MTVTVKNTLWVLVFVLGFSGSAKSQDSITLVGKLAMTGLPIHDVWGYTDSSTGKKYALVCASTQGLRVVDLADITNPVLVGSISGNGVQAIDVKVWKNYAYVVGESPTGVGNIIDLTDPTNPTKVGTFPRAHNIVISDSGYMYLSAPGVRIMNLNIDPVNPVQTYFDNTCNGHDISVIGNRLFDFAWECGTRIFDVSQPDTLVQIGLVPASGMKHHSGWTSKNGDYLFICDEVANPIQNDITSWDITDLSHPILVDSFADQNAYVHNIYVHGDYGYVSFYRAGFRVFDVTDPTHFFMADEYDTDPSASGPGYGGNFGLYTNWGRDTILASDEDNGLFIFSFSGISTGIKESQELKTLVSVYPNPASSTVTIEFTNAVQNREVKIFNSVGKMILKQNLSSSTRNEIAIQNILNGVYVMEIVENENRSIQKLIISK